MYSIEEIIRRKKLEIIRTSLGNVQKRNLSQSQSTDINPIPHYIHAPIMPFSQHSYTYTPRLESVSPLESVGPLESVSPIIVDNISYLRETFNERKEPNSIDIEIARNMRSDENVHLCLKIWKYACWVNGKPPKLNTAHPTFEVDSITEQLLPQQYKSATIRLAIDLNNQINLLGFPNSDQMDRLMVIQRTQGTNSISDAELRV